MTGVHSLLTEGRPGLLTTPGTASSYLAAGGYAPLTDPGLTLDRIAAAGLRGRGGAGFPAAVKLRAVRDAPGRPVVVANGEEGEPGSVKDRWLLRHRPHLVLDGLRIAAAVTGAVQEYVYLSDAPAEQAVLTALAERPPELGVEVVRTEHTYVAGEESAVVRRIDGGPALPTAKPPRPYESGVGGAPTLVANVETLARVALMHAHPNDADLVAATHLLTLSGGAGAALVEVPAGTHLKVLADLCGHGRAEAVLLGGLFGGLHGTGWTDLPLDHDALNAAGGALGCGALHFLHPEDCPVAVAAEAAAHLAAQSARQCGVCVSGTGALAATLAAVARGEADDDTTGRLHRWSRQLPGRGACGLLDAAARIAATLLAHFPDRVDAHRGAGCPACVEPPPENGRRFTVAVP
ncbi:Fe-S-binding domain-containing protein [Streptomyces spinosirectus]|uniref:NADH-ubiquinone oxidoreductase-F iron-sulfur binding region domain-containing protein n=1 Tax=Streptomyces TaxID=1883 RepID=UPI000D3998EF|nr:MULTISPECIES: NADH-ubiquinone oxidoreductase-F iron-sulfur binding region domain-containing protein [Streptomyces]MBY8339317.1 Fe-S-binding domain-containing protein [Streptomyces plumbidurans]PTM93041.1 NADH:ubiquinone oxidoreductase subunit F (NADH-binding) [Streptomyces sp. VMFN-G11Ma]UIR16147.1 Fe-S-binding domain-containing protein [Streptomyces spinosirectus]